MDAKKAADALEGFTDGFLVSWLDNLPERDQNSQKIAMLIAQVGVMDDSLREAIPEMGLKSRRPF